MENQFYFRRVLRKVGNYIAGFPIVCSAEFCTTESSGFSFINMAVFAASAYTTLTWKDITMIIV